ncbi:photosystem II reaction center PsbP [Synechococcus sp. PCC 7336]|uniref:photosystem II reaction center PsbP n=1 Tax=Synechococcus sp. PCC 7336 TaxID=195250 RepID=UPI00034C8524|nr:photosystem II reaction center PsbP [Synechococcus sp. PCC 7336]
MFRRAIAGFLATVVILLTGCSNAVALQTFSDRSGLFSFGYPNGMMQVQGLRNDAGRTLLFRDLVYDDELVSLTVADYDKAERIEDLGSIEAVGRRVATNLLAPAGSDREATLLNGGSLERDGRVYYILEYAVNANGQPRHDVVTVAIAHNKLYTLTASTSESRWQTLNRAFYEVGKSLVVN